MANAPGRPNLAELRAQEQTLEQDIRGLEQHVQDLQQYTRREQRIEQRREGRAWRGELAAERVLTNGKARGLPRDRQAEQMVAKHERTARLHTAAQQLRHLAPVRERTEPQAGATLRVRLHDEERERDQGLGF